MKVVINKCYGGFSISKKCAEYMASKGHKQAQEELVDFEKEGNWYGYGYTDSFSDGYSRTDRLLIEAVEILGEEADGWGSDLQIVEIPDGIDWYIDDYDGLETIREQHRTW